MGSIGGSSCKTTSMKYAMALVPVEVVCFLPKTEPVHLPIYLPYTSLWWRSTGHWHRRKVFYCCGYGQWLLVSSGIRGGAWKTGIIRPRQKAAVESDAYGGPKCISTICSNDDEAKNIMGQNSQITWFETFRIKNYCWWCVTVWEHIQAASRLFQNSPGYP